MSYFRYFGGKSVMCLSWLCVSCNMPPNKSYKMNYKRKIIASKKPNILELTRVDTHLYVLIENVIQ